MTEKQMKKQKKLRRMGLLIMLASILLLAGGVALLKIPKAILPHMTQGVEIAGLSILRVNQGDHTPDVLQGVYTLDVPQEDLPRILKLLEETKIRHAGMMERSGGGVSMQTDGVIYHIYLYPTQSAMDAGAKPDIAMTCDTSGQAFFEYAYYRMQNGEALLAQLASYVPQPQENPPS